MINPTSGTPPTPYTGSFTASFTATINYSANGSPSSTSFTATATISQRSNALRILVVPMGDGTQPYSTYFTSGDNQTLQNAMATMSRIYPVPSGVGDLCPPPPVGAPALAPVAAVGAGTGSVDAGPHVYAITFSDANGQESGPSPLSAGISLGAAGPVAVSALPLGPAGTAARNIYRSKTGTTTGQYYVATVNNNTDTSFTDTTSDANLGRLVSNCRSTATGGIRYTVDPTMLDLQGLGYLSGGVFCGTGANWDGVKGQLAQFLQVWNTANPTNSADRVLGVIDGGKSKDSNSGCNVGMAWLISNEAWAPRVPATAGSRQRARRPAAYSG